MSSRMPSLAQVEAALREDGSCVMSPIRAYVVGYDAPNAFPRKFLYRGCNRSIGRGRFCSKSVEFQICEHDPAGEEVADFFRFDVLVSHGSLGGKPIWATIFNAAANLLGMGCVAFKRLSDENQLRRVAEVIGGLPLCDISVRVGNGSAVVQCLSNVPLATNPPPLAPLPLRGSRSNVDSSLQGSQSSTGPLSMTKQETSSLKKALVLLSQKFLNLTGSSDDDE